MLRYLSLTILLILASSTFSQEKLVDKIVGRAANHIILLSDIQAQKLEALRNEIELTEESDCFILEEVMVKKLLIAKAEIDSVEAPEAQVEQELNTRVQRIMSQFPGGKEEMERFYGKSIAQIKEQFREQIRDLITSQQMEGEITANIKVTPKEIEEFYNSVPLDSLPLINSQVTLSQLVVFPEVTNEDKEEARKKLDDIRGRIVSGDLSFKAAAIIYSRDPGSAKMGGDLGWATRGTMVPEFEEVAFTLDEGQVSEVFESPFGMHVIELIERRGDDYHCRHILIDVQVSPRELNRLQEMMTEAYMKIKNGDLTFEEAIQEYSNDKDNKATKGMLMNPFTGDVKWDLQDINQLDPQMSVFVQDLEIGEITTPTQYMDQIQRKMGIRILRLDARTKAHRANLRDDYRLVQDATLNQKKQKFMDVWVNKTIQEIYVFIDPDYKNCPFRYNWFKDID